MPIKIKGKAVTLHGLNRFVRLAGSDTLHKFKFWISAERKKQFEAYRQCQTFDDYFKFAGNALGLMQRKPEIEGLITYAKEIAPVNVCEIGTYEGGTNFMLSQALPDVKLMMGLDLFVQQTAQLRYFSRPGQEQHYLNGSSHAPQTVAIVEGILAGRKFDLLFIDGDHRYEGVKQDFLCYRHLVREGGIIGFHDIVPDYKTRFGKDTGMWAGGVPDFWKRLSALYPAREFIEDREQDAFGIGAIQYSDKILLPDDL